MQVWEKYRRHFGLGLAIFALVAALVVFWVHRTGLLWAIPRYLQGAGGWGIGISFGLVVLQSIVPYAPFALVAGFITSAYGFWPGFMVAFTGVIAGNLILFALAKQIVRLFFQGKAEVIWSRHPKLEVVRQKVVHARFWTAFSILFILRVQPWVPSSLLDILSGATGVKIKPFFFSTLAGQIPSVAAMAYLGHRLLNVRKFQKGIAWFLGIAIVLGVAFLAWRLFIKGKWQHRRIRL